MADDAQAEPVQEYDKFGFSIPMDHPDHVEPAEPDNRPYASGEQNGGLG